MAMRQDYPKSLRVSPADWELFTKAAKASGRTRNGLIIEASRLFASMALSAANGVSADNATLHPVLTDLDSTAGDGQGGQGPEGKEGKSAPVSSTSHAPRGKLG